MAYQVTQRSECQSREDLWRRDDMHVRADEKFAQEAQRAADMVKTHSGCEQNAGATKDLALVKKNEWRKRMSGEKECR